MLSKYLCRDNYLHYISIYTSFIISMIQDIVHRRAIVGIFIFAIFTCTLSLYLSIYPGVLQGLGAYIGISFLWLLTLASIAIFGLKLWCRRSEPATKLGFYLLASIGLLTIVCAGLLKFYVPRRIIFALSRPAFESWLAAHRSDVDKSRSIDTKIGFYHVEKYAVDLRGGDYFQVHSHGDGLSPDTISYGFVYRPNLAGSPFGAAHYRIYRLGDDWYWFQASDDW